MKRHGFVLLVLAMLLLTVAPVLAQKKTTTSKPVQIPAGTEVQVRIIENLTSETAQPGDVFHGTLAEPIVLDAKEVYPKGSDAVGRVQATHASGRLSDPGVLELVITEISSGNRSSKVQVEPFTIKGESHTKSNVTKIGGGAAVGAVIGAIAGGGKGAAIGAGVGAAAGTGVAAATGKKEAKVESEAVLTFVTAATSTAAAQQPASSARSAEPRSNVTRSYDDDAAAQSFSLHDQRVIRNCFEENASSLPPGLAKRDRLPPGLERQLQRNQTLPPGLQKRVQPLPEVCESQLPRLPRELERVVYNRRVMLIDADNRIRDAFDLDAE